MSCYACDVPTSKFLLFLAVCRRLPKVKALIFCSSLWFNIFAISTGEG